MDVSDWASRIGDFLTLNRSATGFEATREVNRHRHFSGYRISRNRSSSVEGRDNFPRAGLQHNSGYSGSDILSKLKSNNFNGNPLKWQEWSNMLIATADKQPSLDSEKMSHLKTLLAGKPMSVID